jgi:hypothetical protein
MGRYPLVIGEEFLADLGKQMRKNPKLCRILKAFVP